MKMFTIKRKSPSNPRLWEWKMYQVTEDHPYVDLQKFDFKHDAEAVAKDWAAGMDYQIVEIDVPDAIVNPGPTPVPPAVNITA